MRATAVTLGGPVGGEPVPVVGARLGPGPPAVVGVVHVELGHGREGVTLVRHGRVEHLQHEHALARVRGDADPPVTQLPLGLAQRHQRSAAAVAEQHDRLGAPAAHEGGGRGDVDDALLVEAVGVVVLVAGAEAQHAVAGMGEERARVVDREVAAGMARGSPPVRQRAPPGGVHSVPRTSAPSSETIRTGSRGMSTPGSSSGSGQKPRPAGRDSPSDAGMPAASRTMPRPFVEVTSTTAVDGPGDVGGFV